MRKISRKWGGKNMGGLAMDINFGISPSEERDAF
jgi:hypothetical protein